MITMPMSSKLTHMPAELNPWLARQTPAPQVDDWVPLVALDSEMDTATVRVVLQSFHTLYISGIEPESVLPREY
jgi:hypothetical protein